MFTVESGPDGALQGLVAYLVDVSERHVAQRAADERRFLLESIFHASPDTIVVRDISGAGGARQLAAGRRHRHHRQRPGRRGVGTRPVRVSSPTTRTAPCSTS